MTNEMLAEFIQQGGNDELIPILWDNVRNLLYMKADNTYRANTDRFKQCGVEVWDIKQVCYNVMLQAVKGYKSEQGYKFTSYLNTPFLTAVNGLTGSRNSKTETLNTCSSLDVPINSAGSDGEEMNLLNIIPDTHSLDFIDELDAESEALTIWQAVESLVPAQRDVIIARYKENQTQRAIAEAKGVSSESIRQIEHRALRELRKNKTLMEIAKCYNMHKKWLSFSRFEYSPEYFDLVERFREREGRGEHISYGNKQAEIYSLKMKYQQEHEQ